MKFYLNNEVDSKAILVFEETETIETGNKLLNFLKEKELFKGKTGEVYGDFSLNGENVLLVGLGKKDKLTLNSIRKSLFKAGKELQKFKINDIGMELRSLNDFSIKDVTSAVVEGLLHSEYAFDKYLSEKKNTFKVNSINFDVEESQKKELEKVIKETELVMDSVFLARDLVNERAINMYPEVLSNSAKENLKDLGVDVEIFGKEKIVDLKMDAFLAVSKGSEREAQFIVMNYKGDPLSDEKLALVGKGITYDSGGYSIKPTSGMDTMYCDMGGAGTVIGAMKAIASNKLKKNVVGIVAACENLISGGAYKPGDIIGSMSGKTIEVLNTDAEGRITLADSLWYAATVAKADKIIDLATLTGACVVALGDVNTGAITNNKKLMAEVETASTIAGEPIWELPTNPEYEELLKSDFADIKNVAGRGAGTITAGLFLREFIDEKPWVHLDIAATAYLDKKMGYLPKGATGVHVKTLYNIAKES
ncbi:MAG: leucyl aminopeptidase [Tissierella sp.]|uniref:leucyl aminopeptidase n=1 Tax=Tissierella sp. TaxID=41274 RepID=UPI003F9EAAF4